MTIYLVGYTEQSLNITWKKVIKENTLTKSPLTIYTLLFADDQVLITQEYEDMEFVVR